MAKPFVVCVCATYAHVPAHQHLVEEAIFSALNQYYPADRRLLLLLNDNPAQELVCDLPGVRIINYTTRFGSVGEKLNAGIDATEADLICPWDDDDISLPWRLSQGVDQLKEWGDMWKPPQVLFLPNGSKPIVNHNVSVRHHASIFTKAAWRRVGGYAPLGSAYDADMDTKLGGRHLPKYPAGIPIEEWAYCYRFGVSPHHVSSVAGPHGQYAKLGEIRHQPGRFVLKPHWRQDYTALVRDTLATYQQTLKTSSKS